MKKRNEKIRYKLGEYDIRNTFAFMGSFCAPLSSPVFFVPTQEEGVRALILEQRLIIEPIALSVILPGLFVTPLGFRSTGPSSTGPCPGYCNVFLGETLYLHCVSLYPGLFRVTNKLSGKHDEMLSVEVREKGVGNPSGDSSQSREE